jgi:hypothetical protein
MALRVHSDLAIAMCNAGVALLTGGVGAGPALLQIMSGVKPTNLGDAIVAQKILAEFDLPDDLFQAAVATAGGATATANDIDPAAATADAGTGTAATWFRVKDKDGRVVEDGECTDTSGAGPMKLANTTIVQGIDVTVVSWTAFHPV